MKNLMMMYIFIIEKARQAHNRYCTSYLFIFLLSLGLLLGFVEKVHTGEKRNLLTSLERSKATLLADQSSKEYFVMFTSNRYIGLEDGSIYQTDHEESIDDFFQVDSLVRASENLLEDPLTNHSLQVKKIGTCTYDKHTLNKCISVFHFTIEEADFIHFLEFENGALYATAYEPLEATRKWSHKDIILEIASSNGESGLLNLSQGELLEVGFIGTLYPLKKEDQIEENHFGQMALRKYGQWKALVSFDLDCTYYWKEADEIILTPFKEFTVDYSYFEKKDNEGKSLILLFVHNITRQEVGILYRWLSIEIL